MLYLPLKLIDQMGLLSFTTALGGVGTHHEVHSVLKEVEALDWDSVPLCNSSRALIRGRTYYYPDAHTKQPGMSCGSTRGHDPFARLRRLGLVDNM